MKGKLSSIGRVALVLVLALSLSLIIEAPAAKVEASGSVSNVWVELPAGSAGGQNEGLAIIYIIHFTTGSALSRGVDTITVLFPDGIDTDMGPANTATYTDRAFDLSSADSSAAFYKVDPTGDPLGTGAAYVTSTADATVAGYRVKVTTPVDIPASTAAALQITASANIITPSHSQGSDTINTYMIQLATSQDTSFVLSSAFSIGKAVGTAPATETNFPTSEIAGSNAYFKFSFTPQTTVPIGGTVTVEFPVGTTLTSPVATTDVTLGNGTLDPDVSAVSVNIAARTLTATTAKELTTGSMIIYIESGAGIYNPTTVTGSPIKVYISTSTDGLKVLQSNTTWQVVPRSATKLAFEATTSDDATILYAFTDTLIIEVQDEYGNKQPAAPQATVALSVTSGSGAFYTAQDTSNPWGASQSLTSGTKTAYYRPTTVGTHTLKAETVGSPSLTLGEWTVYVAPAVVLKDASGNTIGTYGPLVGSTTDTSYGGAHIQSAIDAAFPGDTVELGDGIYELDTYINLNQKITLTSENGAASTTIRPVAESNWYRSASDIAIAIDVSGTAANPVIIDGLTFDRLRSGVEFDQAIFNNGDDYVTVRNNTFNYIIPEYVEDSEWGSVISFIVATNLDANAASITSATISNNTFTNNVSFAAPSGGDSAVINLMTKSSANGKSITGATISGNTLTDNNGINISVEGYNSTNSSYVTATISNNTITNGISPIYISQQTKSVKVTGNTITGGYYYGIRVGSFSSAKHESLVIKNNTITGVAGAQSTTQSYAIWIQEDSGSSTDPVTLQYNAIYDNDATYNIGVETGVDGVTQAQYNWFGSASGPGTSVSGLAADVTTSPWLHKSLATVVADNASYIAQKITLGVGLHTLSTPALLITTADSIDELMPNYATNMEYVYKYVSGVWSNLGTDALTAGSAYYIKMTIADSMVLKYAADEYYTPSKALVAGWNLISLASLSDMDVDDSVASVKLTAAGLPGYSQVISPSMNASSWSFSVGGNTTNKDLVVGEGYWIYMQNSATVAGFTIFPLVPDLD